MTPGGALGGIPQELVDGLQTGGVVDEARDVTQELKAAWFDDDVGGLEKLTLIKTGWSLTSRKAYSYIDLSFFYYLLLGSFHF